MFDNQYWNKELYSEERHQKEHRSDHRLNLLNASKAKAVEELKNL